MDGYSDFADKAVGVISAVIGVAILAVILSKQAQTSQVISTFFNGLASLIKTAVAPVTKGSIVSATSAVTTPQLITPTAGTGSGVTSTSTAGNAGNVGGVIGNLSSLMGAFGGLSGGTGGTTGGIDTGLGGLY